MSQSPLYANKPLKELYEQLLPALATRQYRVVLNKEEQTVAYISWALVSEAVEQKMQEAGGKLELSDWQSGEIGMLIDVVAKNPTAGNILVNRLKEELFKDKALKAMRMQGDKLELSEVSAAAATAGANGKSAV